MNKNNLLTIEQNLVSEDKFRLCFPFVGDSIGGSHLSALTLIETLALDGDIEVEVVLHKAGPLTEELRGRDLAWTKLNVREFLGEKQFGLRTVFGIVSSVWRITRFLLANKVSIVHTNDMRMHLTWGAACRLSNVKHVWHQRTIFSESRLVRPLLRRAQTIVCISDFVLSSLPTEYHAKAVRIQNPVRPFYVSRARREHHRRLLLGEGNQQQVFLIGVFGSLTHVKQPVFVAEVMSRLKIKSTLPFSLVVFGLDKDGYIPKIESIAANNGWRRAFKFMGLKRPIEPWIAACNLVLAASSADGFGRTLVEAMSLGVPVIATDAGGHREIINHGETGFLACVDDPDEMAEVVNQVMLQDSNESNKVIQNGKEYVAKTCSPGLHKKRMTEIYHRCLWR